MMMIYTAINIPYSALMGVVSSNTRQRTSFSQYRFIFAFIGALIVQGITLPMVESFGKNDNSVINSSIQNNQLVIKENGKGSTKIKMIASIDANKKTEKDIIVSVLDTKDFTNADTTNKIMHFKAGFGTKKIDLKKFFPESDLSSVKISVTNINERKGFQGAMAVLAILAVIMFFITFFTTKERVQPPKEQKTSLKNDLGDLIANKPWWILFALGIFTLTHVSIRNGSIMYYFKYFVGDVSIASAFMLSGTIATIASIMLTDKLSRVFGKKNLYIGSMILTTIFAVVFWFLNPEDIVLMFVFQVLISFSFGPTAPLIFAMYTDAADYSEYKTGRRATGLVMSASTMAQKFGWTIGGALTGWLLAYFGFKANFEQADTALVGIKLMMSIIPAIGSLLGAVLMIFYKLDDKNMLDIELELDRRRSQ